MVLAQYALRRDCKHIGASKAAAPSAGAQSYQYTYECTLSFELQEGMIIDYFTKDRRTPNDPYTHCSHIFGRFD